MISYHYETIYCYCDIAHQDDTGDFTHIHRPYIEHGDAIYPK